MITRSIEGAQRPGYPTENWVFGSPACPIRIQGVPQGEDGAGFEHVTQANVRQAGVTWRGINHQPNMIQIVAHLGPVNPSLFDELHARWRDSLGAGDHLAKYIVETPRGKRWQWVRLAQAVQRDTVRNNPHDTGWCTEQVTLMSDTTWWESTPEVTVFTPAMFAAATVTNFGDVEAWPQYNLTGPGTYTIGLGSEAITLPYISAGESWSIETHPDHPHIRDGSGDDAWPQAGPVAWHEPAPAHQTIQANLSGAGTGTGSRIEIGLPQLWRRARA